MTEGRYVERLHPKPLMWGVVLVLDATFAFALGAALGPVVGWGVLAVTAALTAVGLRAMGGQVTVTDESLEVGRACLPLSLAGPATTLDAEQARRLRGVDADPRAYLWLKGWVGTAVRVDVADEDDPTPYWYVSTRHPQALVDAIEQGRARAQA